MIDSDHAEQDTGEAEYISGSPHVALELEKPFTDYIFIEIDRERLDQLEGLKKGLREPTDSPARKQDCNDYLRKLLNETQWTQWRGVIFLDPFGMQVPWDTIVEIGKTEAIEVFINFPVGMAIQRLLKRSGQFTSKERTKIDRYFGTDEWYDLLYERARDLFEENITKKPKLWRHSRQVVSQTAQGCFRPRFHRTGNSKYPRPSAILPHFAGPNETGARIANDVLRQGARRIQ